MQTNWLQVAMGVFGGLGVFLYGMRLMSQGLDSAGGPKMRQMLQSMTSNPIAGVLTGLLVTCVIQSSSATTVMVVGLTHAGFLSLPQAIGVILGANIGTTMTGWIVAILGFKFSISTFAGPAVGVGVVLIFLGAGKRRALWGEILVGFGLLFLGLMFMQDSVKGMKSVIAASPTITNLLHTYSAQTGVIALLLCVAIGTVMTVVLQSSSATMALTINFAYQGLIDFPTASALILGENIGTTITAYLASLGMSVSARRAARAHMTFNVVGVLWAVALFGPFVSFVAWLAPKGVATQMAAFHTTFNVINTLLFLPLISYLSAFVVRMIPGEERADERHLVYLETSLMATPELALVAARKELQRMAQKSVEMFDAVMKLFEQEDVKAGALSREVAQHEDEIDGLEQELTQYLSEIIRMPLAAGTSAEVGDCMNMAHNFEKVGDHCEALLRFLQKKYDNKITFSEDGKEQIREIAALVRRALSLLEKHVTDYEANFMDEASRLEGQIDKMRGELRDSHITRIVEGRCDANAGLIFIDMLTSFERIGDHAFNIAQYISHQRDIEEKKKETKKAAKTEKGQEAKA
ncbi:MAG: Na/Pi cotransporter family protein [Myxococcales bacterium]|nr:Na/Pi cotransporter family protein [Myxococcales bacterium]